MSQILFAGTTGHYTAAEEGTDGFVPGFYVCVPGVYILQVIHLEPTISPYGLHSLLTSRSAHTFNARYENSCTNIRSCPRIGQSLHFSPVFIHTASGESVLYFTKTSY